MQDRVCWAQCTCRGDLGCDCVTRLHSLIITVDTVDIPLQLTSAVYIFCGHGEKWLQSLIITKIWNCISLQSSEAVELSGGGKKGWQDQKTQLIKTRAQLNIISLQDKNATKWCWQLNQCNASSWKKCWLIYGTIYYKKFRGLLWPYFC